MGWTYNVGKIKLIYKEGIVQELSYCGRKARNKIIEAWKHQYGQKFYKCFIQVALYDGAQSRSREAKWEKAIEAIVNKSENGVGRM